MNDLLNELLKEQEHIPDGVWDTVKDFNSEEKTKKREESWLSQFFKSKSNIKDEKER